MANDSFKLRGVKRLPGGRSRGEDYWELHSGKRQPLEAVEQLVDEGVHDGQGLEGRVGVDLLQHHVDVDGDERGWEEIGRGQLGWEEASECEINKEKLYIKNRLVLQDK